MGCLAKRNDFLVVQPASHPNRTWVVRADCHKLTRTLSELSELRFECVEAPVVVKVIWIDVCHQGNRRLIVQERAVGFISFDHEEVVGARARRSPESLNNATVDERWVHTKFQQCRDDHSRAGGFAVRARNCNQSVLGS
jgi:hypothetical protein